MFFHLEVNNMFSPLYPKFHNDWTDIQIKDGQFCKKQLIALKF